MLEQKVQSGDQTSILVFHILYCDLTKSLSLLRRIWWRRQSIHDVPSEDVCLVHFTPLCGEQQCEKTYLARSEL